MEKAKYVIYYKNNKMITTKTGEEYVATFDTIEKAIEFINLCTLYDVTYKIYFIENQVKKLCSAYEYLPVNPNDQLKNNMGHCVKKSWQKINPGM